MIDTRSRCKLALLLILIPAMLDLGSPVAAGAQPLTKVSIAILPSDSTSEAWVAYDRGTFRQAGLDVTIDMMASGPVIAAAVASNSADFGAANLISLAAAYTKGVPFVLVAPAGTSTSQSPTIGLVVAKTSPITTARALNGDNQPPPPPSGKDW